jgi:hypothetical protein
MPSLISCRSAGRWSRHRYQLACALLDRGVRERALHLVCAGRVAAPVAPGEDEEREAVPPDPDEAVEAVEKPTD